MSLEQALTDLITKAVRDALKDSAPAPAKPRGRPAKGETNGVADPAPTTSVSTTAQTPEIPAPVATALPASTTSAPAVDPFATAPTAPQPTIDEVMTAARELSSATSQQNAVDVLKKATGASSRAELKPEHHAVALAALKAALPAADPFGAQAATPPSAVPAAATAAATSPTPSQSDAPGLEAVKAAIRDAQKRTGVDIVQRVIMEHGGKKVDASVPGGFGPSVQALSVPSYAAVIAALNALPKTK